MVTIHKVEQGTEEWHKLRAGKYTGSNIHKLLRGGGSIEIINGMRSNYGLTTQASFSGNFHTKRGHLLEEESIELYETITGKKVDRPGFVTNDAFPTCGYSPDGLIVDAVIECKSFNEKKHMEMYKGDIPLSVMAQVHFGMSICEKKMAYLLIYNPDLDPRRAFKIIPIKYDKNIAKHFKAKLGAENVRAHSSMAA